MTRVLVTGAEGFTGGYLVPQLRAAGHEVHALVRSPGSTLRGASAVHACDLEDVEGLIEVVRQAAPERVVHLAGISFVGHDDADAIYRSNLIGTRHLLVALESSPVPPQCVLLASSSNIYGNATPGVLDESCPPDPANEYAVSKLAMEHMARLFARRLPIVIARPFNYTGVGQSESFLLPKIVAHVRRRSPVIELGNLDIARDFSDVRMLVSCYCRLLDTPAAVGQTVNVCSGRAYTLSELVDMVRELSGHHFQVRVNPAFIRENDVKVLWGDRSRLESLIGNVPPMPMRDTLRWMLDAPAATADA